MREPFLTWNESIAPQDTAAMARAKAHWDGIAKPLQGLGKLETAVTRIAGLTGDEHVSLESRTVLVLCADNGIVEESVTQTDASVTATMARRIYEHRSSVCLMAKTARANVIPVDLGMLTRVPDVYDLHVGNGTANMAKGPAMTEAQAMQAIENGVRLARERKAAGNSILVTGEMGIGNTSTSSAIASVLLNLPVETVTGRGAGLSDEGLKRKRAAIRTAIEVNDPDPSDPFDVLYKLGGFDIAGLCGLYIGAAIERIPILIDGLISSVAALVAARLVPNCRTAMLASHCSKEPVAQAILKELGIDAILYADMKLGEGTGAVCMLPLLDMALAVYNGSVTFSETAIEQYVPQGGEPC
jgi:nicotinate-nucleotide--dimethylbenzimidazole phosphoribosyltransferase